MSDLLVVQDDSNDEPGFKSEQCYSHELQYSCFCLLISAAGNLSRKTSRPEDLNAPTLHEAAENGSSKEIAR